MKKWLGTICSFAASIFTFIFMAIPVWSMEQMGTKTSFNGYELISGETEVFGQKMNIFEDYGAWSRYRIFAIVLLVLAAILAVYAVFMLLINLNVLKIEGSWISTVNKVLLTVTLVAAVLALTAVLSINGDIAKDIGIKVKDLKEMYDNKIGTQVGIWLVAGVNAIACACGWLLGRESK